MPSPGQTASLEPAQSPQNLTPRKGQSLLQIDVAAHHPPPQQQLGRDRLRELFNLFDRLGAWQQRPAALDAMPPAASPPARSWPRVSALPTSEARARVQQRADR